MESTDACLAQSETARSFVASFAVKAVKRPDPILHILWRDIVAIIDDGRQSAPAYRELVVLAEALRNEHPRGYGVLIIIPKNARPPSDSTRRAINEALDAAAGGLKSVCWLVEGKGFQAAMARAVLTSLRLFPGIPFETSVKSDLNEALQWTLSCLRGSRVNISDELAAAQAFFNRRRP